MNGIIVFAGVIFFLWWGRSLFIPFLVAVFLWYLINAIATYYRKIMPFKECVLRDKNCTIKSSIFNWVSLILAIITLGLVGYVFATQIRPMFSELLAALPTIQDRLVNLGNYISDYLGIKFDDSILPNITNIASNIGASLASIAASVGMISVYILFLFVEQSTFNRKFVALFSNRKKSKKTRYILSSIDDNMKKYLFMKTFISAITGICSYLWLQMIGLEFAGVWAFIVFITSYIPTIGAIVACGLPILYAMVTSGDFHLPVLTAGGLIGLQILFGNIIEPKLTGKTLNLSTLAILLNLVFWGMLWGIAGMFFSVPLLVATFVITAQFDSTRWIAVLLSADGNIPDKKD